ncbi:D-isomer specific 2-hydroxyacid dehydrogenase [Mycena leptocephala]|nr:D-isomer specific 2-hydroxyacid dehydrogenase [Mycena leptocephala]
MPLLQDRKDIEIVLWPEERPCERSWLLQNIKGVAGVLTPLTARVPPSGPSLRVVSTMSVGYGVYRNISISRSWPNGTSESVTFCGPQLSTTASSPTRTVGFRLRPHRAGNPRRPRRLRHHALHYTNSSTFRPETTTVRDAALQTIHKLKALEHVDFSRLTRDSDVFFVLAPGGNETHHLVDAIFLRKMKPMSVLVDTGSVVSLCSNDPSVITDGPSFSHALATAVHEKWIWGAVLDVMEDEPAISKDHPLVKEPRLVPHFGSATLQTRLDMATCAIDNLVGGLFGGEMQ